MTENDITTFAVHISGEIETVKFPGGIFDSEIYLRYDVVHGVDWEIFGGLRGAISQLASRGESPEEVVFNFPVDVLFRSTNVFGWPQLVISVYGMNKFGVEGVRGYGRIHLPAKAGCRKVIVPLVVPQSATMLGEWLSWLTGKPPELAYPTVLAAGKDNYCQAREDDGQDNEPEENECDWSRFLLFVLGPSARRECKGDPLYVSYSVK